MIYASLRYEHTAENKTLFIDKANWLDQQDS